MLNLAVLCQLADRIQAVSNSGKSSRLFINVVLLATTQPASYNGLTAWAYFLALSELGPVDSLTIAGVSINVS